MKFATFRHDGAEKIGAIVDADKIIDLMVAAQDPLFSSMISLIEGGDAALERAHRAVARCTRDAIVRLSDVRLCAPIPTPPQIRDFLCFEKHLVQSYLAVAKLRGQDKDSSPGALEPVAPPKVWYQQPVYYKGNRFAVSGPFDDIRWPSFSNLMDYECELACVIGRGGRDISRATARNHIFGYTIFNDFSARDAQAAEMQALLGPAKGKDFDTANAMGPWLVSADEVGDPHALSMVVRVNGAEVSRGSSSEMHWKFEDIIAHASLDETLFPGEVLASGTVGGGSGLERLEFLSDGDVVEIEIEKIGILKNRIVRNGKETSGAGAQGC